MAGRPPEFRIFSDVDPSVPVVQAHVRYANSGRYYPLLLALKVAEYNM